MASLAAWHERILHGCRAAPPTAVQRTGSEVAAALRGISGYSLLTGFGLAVGFVRELTVASTFGLSPQLDVFVAVMTVQLFFGAQVGNALETAFISRLPRGQGPSAVVRSVKAALCGLLFVNAAILLLLFISGPSLITHLFPRFDVEQQALATRTLNGLLLPMAFASSAGLLRGSLAVLGSFAPGFIAGSLMSLCTIVSITLFSPRLGIDALTLGVAVGNLGVLLLFALRLMLSNREATSEGGMISPHTTRDGWFVLWGAAASLLVAELVYGGIALTERSLASWLMPGSIAAFFYAATIVAVPLSLFMVPLTTTAFPAMVQAFQCDVRVGCAQLRKQALLLVTISLIVVLVVVAFADAIVETLFMRGKFSSAHAALTASILSVTILALPFMSVSRLIRNAFYALSDYKTPVVGLLMQWMVLAGLGAVFIPRYGTHGLAMAMVAGEAVVLGTMTMVLVRRVGAR